MAWKAWAILKAPWDSCRKIIVLRNLPYGATVSQGSSIFVVIGSMSVPSDDSMAKALLIYSPSLVRLMSDGGTTR